MLPQNDMNSILDESGFSYVSVPSKAVMSKGTKLV
jgi:hypothetical protein